MLPGRFPALLAVGFWLISHHIEDSVAEKPWWDRSTDSTTYKPRPNSKLTASYFFPYVCSIVYLDKDFKEDYRKSATWVSTCTILTNHWVAASVDNFNFRTPDTKYYFYHDMDKLQVNAGTLFGAPSPTAKGLRNLQQLAVERFVTFTDNAFINGGKSDLFKVTGAPDRKMNLNRAAEKNVLTTFQWDVAFLRVKSGFKWSPQVLPAPQIEETHFALTEKVNNFVQRLERSGGNQNCILAGWNRFTHRLGFFTVNYIPQEMCQSAFCAYDTRACLNFPDPDMHVCFKSIDYGSDACPEDRGSALYCNSFGQSVLAILTTAPNCGLKSLPGVYTLINRVVQAFGETGSTEPIKNLPSSDLDGYTLPPSELNT